MIFGVGLHPPVARRRGPLEACDHILRPPGEIGEARLGDLEPARQIAIEDFRLDLGETRLGEAEIVQLDRRFRRRDVEHRLDRLGIGAEHAGGAQRALARLVPFAEVVGGDRPPQRRIGNLGHFRAHQRLAGLGGTAGEHLTGPPQHDEAGIAADRRILLREDPQLRQRLRREAMADVELGQIDPRLTARLVAPHHHGVEQSPRALRVLRRGCRTSPDRWRCDGAPAATGAPARRAPRPPLSRD